jgi:hypothetical protein
LCQEIKEGKPQDIAKFVYNLDIVRVYAIISPYSLMYKKIQEEKYFVVRRYNREIDRYPPIHICHPLDDTKRMKKKK